MNTAAWLALIAAALYMWPYVLIIIKRAVFAARLAAVCRKKRFGLYWRTPVSLFSPMRGRFWDAAVETGDTVYSIKLFTSPGKRLRYDFNGPTRYLVTEHLTRYGVSSIVMNRIPKDTQYLPRVDFRSGLPSARLKAVAQCALFVPAPAVIGSSRGSIIATLDSGDDVRDEAGGFRVYRGGDFLDMLSHL